MKMSQVVKILIVLVLFLTLSCNSNVIYDNIQKISSDGWTKEETISFRAPVNDTTHSYNIYLHIRNTSKYEYSNLWLFINTIAPNGESLSDTTEFFLADPSGQWLGKGLGSVNTMLIPYRVNVRFPHRGIYTFEIKQGMRKEILENILDVGIRIQQFRN
jgi:gliding motility-associated lipoprotein GldH